ncbi:MAG: PIN domain-containing protein [Oscillospiraceae bacterium]|jgi:tRNA(fMet)-specific endonuclease VapC|nr:PIN domain-containing protein [Oscillospiraceae bacterium]
MLYSLDACTLILSLRNNPNVFRNIKRCKEENNVILISPIAYYEVLRGLSDIKAYSKIERIRAVYDVSQHYIALSEKSVMEKAADVYIELKKKGFTVGSNDIIIAAWSMLAGAVLVTDNVKDFENIDGLKIENWRE